MIEPAAYGIAVSFGPNTQNFRDIVAALLSEQAAVVVHNGDELTAFVRRALDDPMFAGELGERAKAFVASQLGATDRTLAHLLPLFASNSPGGMIQAVAAANAWSKSSRRFSKASRPIERRIRLSVMPKAARAAGS